MKPTTQLKLSFREDNTLKIVQFTDIHWKNTEEADLRSRALMEQVLQAEKPDLVVFTGDVIYTGGVRPGAEPCRDPLASLGEAVAVVEQSQTPWALVFGNHDSENGVTREELADAIGDHKYSLFEQGPADISGVGNYVIQVTDGEGAVKAALYFLDSGCGSPVPHVKGYDWIRRDQIAWYEQQSRQLTANHGVPLPSLAFFHIPLPEYQDIWEQGVCYGQKFEDVCCARVNSGLFAAMVEMGDVMGTFVGHDHVNDYWGEMHGIRLCYGRATGYNTYGREGFPRGARVIRMYAGERRFDTWLRLDDGSVVMEQPKQEAELK
ncbi:metallophosphoesterase family protein [Paenibacillus cremeus]|uniref:Metallophosphoesterase n=1 Tax=Paenibacillus cremeus TaxID=2163881 RepID=A0A559KFP9_9BACL|nr:metallophosphoesterase family protein [Paenibacillus cremeus]TVY10946.1 metallophosphoesterase [Paenibacillus cremeus]